MKIVCDACSAKYSIADEKVQGKVFKIRCKKCSNIIVVRGTGGAEEAAPAAAAAAAPGGGFDQKETRVYDYGGYEGGQAPADEAAWHIVVDQEQVGPLTVAEVQARFAAGEVDGESYVWREGFTDWLPLSQVPEFANLVVSGSTTAAQPSSGADAVASMFGASAFDDPAAAAPKSDPGDVFAAHAAKQEDDAGSDLFGQKAAAAAPRAARRTGPPPAEADAPLFGGEAKSAQPAPVSTMKGQRNENSVLFSLGNLAALASDQPRAPAAAAASSSGAATGAAAHGGGEGSGLIDIRSMASAYLGGAKPGAGAGAGPKVGSADDLPVFSTATFAEPAVIIPTMGAAKNNNKMLYALLGAVAFIAILAVVLVVVVLNKKDDKSGVSANQTDPDKGSDKIAAKDPDKGSDKAPDPIAGSAANPDGAGSAAPPAAGSDTDRPVDPATRPADPTPGTRPVDPATRPADPPSKPSSGSSRGSSKPSSGSSKPSGGSSASTKPADPPPSSGGSCMGEVECMLAPKPPACCAKYGGGRKTGGGSTSGGSTSGGGGGGGGDLADSLTKSDISAGVAKVSSKAQACGAKSSAKGTVKVSVKVAANGTVSSVSVKESPDAALGSCVAGAMQKATFAKTKNGGSFSYPFRF